jgi:antitoxin (DNA-binding transcriptional repressor) of toxin-antitoxin stability system
MAQVTSRDISELIDRRAPGVKVLITRAAEDVAFINLISVPPTQRGFGLGQRALNLICQTADARDWMLSLHPSGDLGADYHRLVVLGHDVGNTLVL